MAHEMVLKALLSAKTGVAKLAGKLSRIGRRDLIGSTLERKTLSHAGKSILLTMRFIGWRGSVLILGSQGLFGIVGRRRTAELEGLLGGDWCSMLAFRMVVEMTLGGKTFATIVTIKALAISAIPTRDHMFTQIRFHRELNATKWTAVISTSFVVGCLFVVFQR